jgi:5-formyltetrahydrofolate cyclo-ligase
MTVEPRIACESATTVVESAHSNDELKRLLRRRLLDGRATIASAEAALYDAAIATRLARWLERCPSKVLGVYWPIRGEPDLRPLYATLAAAGVRLALPVMCGAQSGLQFAAWRPGDPLAFDRFGIATPAVLTHVAPDTLLVPCVGFNPSLHRLGYGGGFYDRTVDFSADAHDIPMDVVITEVTPE